MFWALLSNPKHSGVLEDPKSPTLGVGVSSSHFAQSKVATFAVDIELKVDNKLLFTITPTSSILVKVLGMAEAMSSVDDKVDEDDYDNDIKEED